MRIITHRGRAARVATIIMLGVATAGATVSCGSSGARVQYDKAADFTALKQYAWREGRLHGLAERGLHEQQIAQMIREAVDNALGEKGYHPAQSGAADFEVTYQAIIEEKTAVETLNEPYIRSVGGTTYNDPVMSMAYGTQTYEYDAGTLVIDIVDAKTQKLLWRGAAERVMQEGVSAEIRRQRIKEVVEEMLKKFPPK